MGENKNATKAATANRSATSVAVETLRQLIMENELPAGSNHLESELAERLGISRTPVREAILVLESQGLLEVKPRRGVKITSLSGDDMAEIYQILTALESLAAKLAAQLNLSDKDFISAENAIVQMDEALSKDDRESWAKADEMFHRELVKLGGNMRLTTMISMYNDQVRRVRALTLYLRPLPLKSNDDHRNVLAAIRDRKPELAQQLHEQHRVQSGEMLVGLLKQYGFHQV